MNSTGYVLNGVYYKHQPDMASLKTNRAVTDKGWDHDSQRRNHKADLVQPYKNGKPNPEFIQLYPKESKDYGFN